MDERIKARYIDPMVDWSFKRLFGSEVNKDILIEFLKVIFPEHEIEDITSKIICEITGLSMEEVTKLKDSSGRPTTAWAHKKRRDAATSRQWPR